MKRDLNLIRGILITMASGQHTVFHLPKDACLDRQFDQILFEHGRLICEAGWATAEDLSDASGPTTSLSINNRGHDLAALMRPDDRWEKIQPMLDIASMDLILDKLEQLARLETLKIGRD